MTTTDILVSLLLSLFFLMGWLRGIIRSAVDPFCFIIFSLFGIIYFDVSQNLIISILIVLIGTVLSILILRLGLGIAWHSVSKQDRHFVFWPSRVIGGFISLVWQGMLLILALVIIKTLPPSNDIRYIQEDIDRSVSYQWANERLIGGLPTVRATKETLETLTDPIKLSYLRDTREYQNLYNHPAVQRALSDPITMQQIRDKDIAELLINPKFKELLTNEHVMKNFTTFSEKVYEMKAGQQPAPDYVPAP